MSFPDRFLSKVMKSGDCWLWTAAKHRQGYGNFYWRGSVILSHRASYFFATGTMPHPSMKVCHRCDTPSCVNPSHLFLGTQADNVADMVRKKRLAKNGKSGAENSQAKLTDEQVAEIRAAKASGKELAARFGVAQSTVSMIRRGHNWNANRRAEIRLTQ